MTSNKIPDPISISFLFKNLEGLWQLKREITGSPSQATMAGEGRFRPAKNNVLTYQEEGKLSLGDGRYYEAFRRYTYQFEEGTIRVFFSDGNNIGQLFHALEFTSVRHGWPIVAIGSHQCLPDEYKIGYEFLEPNRFRITYHAAGQRKNYVSSTLFTR